MGEKQTTPEQESAQGQPARPGRPGHFRSLGDAFWVGGAAGLLFGLLDGLPVLLEGPELPHVAQRLWVLYYGMVFYALLWAILVGLGGAIVVLVRHRRGHRPERLRLAAGYAAFAVAVFAILYGLYNLQPLQSPVGPQTFPGPSTPWQIDLLQRPVTVPWDERLVGLLLVLPLSLGLGLLVGWLFYASARWVQEKGVLFHRLSGPAWRRVGWIVLAVVLLPLVGRLCYQGFGRDLPLFNRSTGQRASTDYPNIVLISIDALRADALGAYGYDSRVSPNIDGLASQGVLFENAVSQAPWTYPSFLSLHTSLYPSALAFDTLDIYKYSLDSARNTLAEVLHQEGYRTQAYVTNDWLSIYTGLNQGFDDYGSPRPPLSFDPEYVQQYQPVLYTLRQYVPFLAQAFERGYNLLFDPRLSFFDGGERVNAYVQRFLRLYHNERFFLWIHYIEPHATYNPSQPFLPLPAGVGAERESWLRRMNELSRFRWVFPLLDPASLEALRSLYAGEVADADARVGEVLRELERWGLRDRTVIVIAADHGEEFGDHGALGHGQALYQEQLHVPLIISGPPVTVPGQRVQTVVQNIDLMPTLLEIAHATLPLEVQGRSLLPFLRGETMAERPAFSEANYVRFAHWDLRAVREGDAKLVYLTDQERTALYDLRLDPAEQRNLAAERADLVAALVERVHTWIGHMSEVRKVLKRVDAAGEIDERAQEILRNLGY